MGDRPSVKLAERLDDFALPMAAAKNGYTATTGWTEDRLE